MRGKEPVNAPRKMLRALPGPVPAEGPFLRPLGDHVLILEVLQGFSLGAEECRLGKSQLCLLEFSRQQETQPRAGTVRVPRHSSVHDPSLSESATPFLGISYYSSLPGSS